MAHPGGGQQRLLADAEDVASLDDDLTRGRVLEREEHMVTVHGRDLGNQTVPTNFLQQLEFTLTQKSEGIGKVAEILQLSLVGSLVSFLFAKNVALSFSRRLSSVFDSRK